MEEPIGQLPNPADSNSLDKYLVSRKRKNEENIENGDQNGVQSRTKKLKWETISNKRCEAHIEHAIYFNKEETQDYFEKLEKQIKYLRFALQRSILFENLFWTRAEEKWAHQSIYLLFIAQNKPPPKSMANIIIYLVRLPFMEIQTYNTNRTNGQHWRRLSGVQFYSN